MAGSSALGPLLALVALVAGACSESAPAGTAPSPSAENDRTSLTTDTSAQGRVDFGCALQRGIAQSNAVVRHYGSMASRTLFRAALEEQHDYAIAARLWNANDGLVPDDSAAVRRRLLDICEEAGGPAGTDAAGMDELRSYMCAMSEVVAEDRPTVGSYGVASDSVRPGDPRRTDVEFVSVSQFLLIREDDEGWLDVDSLAIALDTGEDEQYRQALEQMASACSQGPRQR